MHEISSQIPNTGEFNPFEHCITIAPACNRLFRKQYLVPDTIASEPVRGRHGIGKPHTCAAVEWLYWQEHIEREARHQAITPEEWEQHDLMANAYPDYPHPFMEPDKIHHAENQGEKMLLITNRPTHVDGYNPDTRTVVTIMVALPVFPTDANKSEAMTERPWTMCTGKPWPETKLFAKPATASLSNGNVVGNFSNKTVATSKPLSMD